MKKGVRSGPLPRPVPKSVRPCPPSSKTTLSKGVRFKTPTVKFGSYYYLWYLSIYLSIYCDEWSCFFSLLLLLGMAGPIIAVAAAGAASVDASVGSHAIMKVVVSAAVADGRDGPTGPTMVRFFLVAWSLQSTPPPLPLLLLLLLVLLLLLSAPDNGRLVGGFR
jgi:hypothetical protein